MEAMWETEPAPAGFTLIAIPTRRQCATTTRLHIPYVMGLIGTRSMTKEIPGINEIMAKNRERIVSGIEAVTALEALRKNPTTPRCGRRSNSTRPTSASACC